MVAKQYQREREEALLKEFNYDFVKEQQFRNEQERRAREEERDQIEFNARMIREKERAETDKYKGAREKEQREREEERRKGLEAQVDMLRGKERELQEEIEFLKKMKMNPVKGGK